MDYTRSFAFDSPGTIKYGIGIAESVGEEVKRFGAKKVLIVTDKGIVKAGLLDKVLEYLKPSKVETIILDEIEPNPKDESVIKGVALAREGKADLVLGVGGGSALDASKAIALVVTNGGSIQDYQGADKVKKPPLPLIVIPTTAGTGAEVSPVLIITDTSTVPATKFGVFSRLACPRVALADPLMTKSLPPGTTASIGMDGLTTAIESYVSVKASPLTEPLSLGSIRLIANNLPTAFANGDDLEARANMVLGSLLASVAFFNSSVGGVHTMASAIEWLYDTPHGLSCAVCLPHVMEYNLSASTRKYADIAQAMGENVTGLSVTEAAAKSVAAVRRLMKDIAIPSPQQVGVKEADIPQLAKKVAARPSVGNPRKLTEEDFVKLFELALRDGQK